MAPKPFSQRRVFPWRQVLYGLIAIVGLCLVAGISVINLRPGVAAEAADSLRAVFGDEFVGKLETTVYTAQDTFNQLRYRLLGKNSDRQLSTSFGEIALAATITPPVASPTSLSLAIQPTPFTSSTTNQPTKVLPTQPSTPTPIPPWSLQPLSPLGNLENEGVWVPYIQDQNGTTVAYRSVLQPDPERSYAAVAIVAFDLQAVQLHYLVGLDEPASEVRAPRPGVIPEEDRRPGKLLAVFNGGFKARHGHFGVMTGGIVWLPPKDGLGTLAIYPDGSLKLGIWGKDIDPQADMLAWRQNGPLVVENGLINPNVSSDNPKVWGYTIQEMAPIWRSAIGLSMDGRVLYYFAGPSLTLPALAKGIAAVGPVNAIQLDINNYWVHFDAIRALNGKLSPLPLFEYMGRDNPDRYLQVYTRDYFYVTTRN